jgi:hypothetical protein
LVALAIELRRGVCAGFWLMLVRPKRTFASGMLVFYAGMMLFGQGLHHFLGCEHEHNLLAVQSEARANSEASAAIRAEAVEDAHDADNCPICQFQAQGQIAATIAASELRQLVVPASPVYSPPSVAVFAVGIPGPRPPPSV